MKKLIITACAMALGVVANAAAIEWYTTDAIKDSKGVQIADGLTAYLIDATYADTAFVTAWASGGIAGALAAADAYVVDSAGYTYDGYVVADEPATYGNRAISAYYAVVNGDELFISHTQLAENDPVSQTNSSIGFNPDNSAPTVQAGAYAGGAAWVQNVPEPTSGLLLLLGMAGLALKRKRA